MATTVILPVYNAPAALDRCLTSLRQYGSAIDHLQIIDDASPDPQIAELLASLAPFAFPFSIQRNPNNLGFVGTVNAGMDATADDVLLLNSDTVVTDGWLEAIHRCAASDARIASITPFSNNAEICSFPEFCVANPEPADPELISAALKRVSAASYPDLPTGVGFCMWLRRDALKAVGAFDQATFGRGYGEENDWCMRSAAHGWRHVLCDDAYVIHQGGQSFSAEGLAPGGENLQRLLARYPHYNALIASFIQADPLASSRQALAAALGGAG